MHVEQMKHREEDLLGGQGERNMVWKAERDLYMYANRLTFTLKKFSIFG